jgi:hypothetical protein
LPIAYASRSYRMGYKIFQTLFVWAKVWDSNRSQYSTT